jgi:tetratricopeptide (TPR) repeat protein
MCVATKLFCKLVPEHRGRRSELETLLAPLGGVPLALTLFAQAAEGNDLGNLASEWTRRKTALLQRYSAGSNRFSSWSVCVELSIASKRMTADALRLAAVLSVLPDGIAVGDLDALFDNGSAAARILSQVGLAFFEEKRLKMLAPVREHFTQEHTPDDADLDRAMEHYGELARMRGPMTGTLEGAAAAARLAPETANLDAMIRRGLGRQDVWRWIDTALALAGFSYLSGRSTPSPLDAARAAAEAAGEVPRAARCIVRIGDLEVRRAEHTQALEKFERALQLYRQESDLLGAASCIRRLGDLAQQRSDLTQAEARYEEALSLSERANDIRGQALCIKGLGRVALDRGDHERARAKYEEALPLFKQVKDTLGEAGSIRRLGDIALQRGHSEEARERYETARALCQKVADVLGEARSIRGLGDVASLCSQIEDARERYKEAIPLFQRTGNAAGETECERRLKALSRVGR